MFLINGCRRLPDCTESHLRRVSLLSHRLEDLKSNIDSCFAVFLSDLLCYLVEERTVAVYIRIFVIIIIFSLFPTLINRATSLQQL
jgi:hypothetical protein